MGNTYINTGGGGFVYGDRGVAHGAAVNIGTTALDKAELSRLISALGRLKEALLSARAFDGQPWAAQVAAAERGLLAQDGGGVDGARRLLARVRFAGLRDQDVLGALAQASPHLTRAAPAEVFVSYKREERDRVRSIAEALRQLCIRVWMDDELAPGGSFTDEICDQIDLCRAQIVCWSQAAIASDWVRGEAEIGRQRGVLVCVALQPCRLTPPFNVLHVEDLSHWRGEPHHASWRKVLQALSEKLSRPDLTHLAHAIAQQDGHALSEWRRKHPNDPFSLSAEHG